MDRQRLIPSRQPTEGTSLYKSGGVYVVIGGAGGIGEVWSEYVIRTYGAQVIWLGRRAQDAAIESKLKTLSAVGPAPHYIAADAADRESLQMAYERIKARYGRIDGVVHSALVLLDKSIANMDESRFVAGLSAKVDVSVRMAQVFSQESLDFALFFSAMNAFTKSPGQSNYAAGCVFKDAFAHELGRQWSCAVKVMNWGYWGSVGVVASQDYRDRMAKQGVGSIEAPEAMQAIETLLSGDIDQLALIKTTKQRVLDDVEQMELMHVYPQSQISIIDKVREHLIKPKKKLSIAGDKVEKAQVPENA